MKCLELFSGAGGLALGLEKAGFESVALVERNQKACQTLRLNRPHWNVLEADIRDVSFARYQGVDLVAGGPPCQPFSMGGKARGYDDHRDMFPEAVRAVREIQPKAFLFENVRGLLRPAFQPYVEFIRLQLTYPAFPVSDNLSWEENAQRLQRHHNTRTRVEGLSYQVSLHLVDAADYGVPQRRHRVFFVGFRSDVDAKWFFPTPTHSADALLRAKYISGDYWREQEIRPIACSDAAIAKRVAKLETAPLFKTPLRWQTVRDALRGLDDPGPRSKEHNHVLQPGAKAYPGHTGSPLDEPSKALKAGDHGVPGGENMLCLPSGKVRYFTVRESARIQTFPDEFLFPGAWTENMRQLGNAVPMQLAYRVSQSVAAHLRQHERSTCLQSAR